MDDAIWYDRQIQHLDVILQHLPCVWAQMLHLYAGPTLPVVKQQEQAGMQSIAQRVLHLPYVSYQVEVKFPTKLVMVAVCWVEFAAHPAGLVKV